MPCMSNMEPIVFAYLLQNYNFSGIYFDKKAVFNEISHKSEISKKKYYLCGIN